MTGKRWTREMYIQLGNLLEKKATPGDMAARFGVSKPDISYYVRMLKDQSTVLAIPEEELELLDKKPNLESFLHEYTVLFGKHRDTGIAVNHWMNRDKYLAAWYKEKEKRKAVHKVIVRNLRIKEGIKEAREIPIDDGDNDVIYQLKKLNNNVALLLQVQQETHALLERVVETFNDESVVKVKKS